MESVNIINDLKNSINPANTTDVFVKGYYSPNDGGGGNFYWDATSTEPENNGTIFLSSFTSTGRWKRIYNNSINVLWFGAKPNAQSSSDQTITSDAIQNAINIFTEINTQNIRVNNKFGQIIIPTGIYYLNKNLITYTGIHILGIGNPTLFRTGIFSSKANFISIKNTFDPVNWTYSKIAIQGLILTANVSYTDIPNALFTTNLTAINISTGQFQILDCSIFGFDKAVEFETNSYLITFQGCGFRQNNYGIYFDATNKTNLGENICFIHCTIAGNQYGIYNKLGGLYFNNCSIDYNNIMHIEDNISKISGTLSLNMVIDNCHIENTVERVGKGIRMKNSGVLVINNSIITDTLLGDSSTTNPYIENDDLLILTNNCFRMVEGRYFAKGTGLVSETNTIPIANDQIARVSINNSGLRNGSFDKETSFSNLAIEGWTINDGSNASITTSNIYDSIYALKIAPTSSFIGTSVISDYIRVPIDRLSYIITGWKTFSSIVGYCNIHLYDKDKSIIVGSTETVTFSSLPELKLKFKLAKKFENKTEFLRIELRCGHGDTSKAIYFDDIYLSFLVP